MHETGSEVRRLQSLLDESYALAGRHIKTIHTPERRLSAEAVCAELTGVCVLDLATVNSEGRPFVSPVDGLFLGGQFWFGSADSSLRFRHIRGNPHVSAAHTRGEELSILIHGIAHEIDSSTGEHERLHDYCREIYGDGFDSWGYWGKAPYAWIEPARMFAMRMETAG